MSYEFTVPGDPRGKGRPKFYRMGKFVGTYKDDKTAAYENLVRMAFKAAYPIHEPIGGTVLSMELAVFFRVPKSASMKTKCAMYSGALRPGKKPDCSNILKAVEDGLNGVAYNDDYQIVDVEVHKWYSETPRVDVAITTTVGGSHE